MDNARHVILTRERCGQLNYYQLFKKDHVPRIKVVIPVAKISSELHEQCYYLYPVLLITNNRLGQSHFSVANIFEYNGKA